MNLINIQDSLQEFDFHSVDMCSNKVVKDQSLSSPLSDFATPREPNASPKKKEFDIYQDQISPTNTINKHAIKPSVTIASIDNYSQFQRSLSVPAIKTIPTSVKSRMQSESTRRNSDTRKATPSNKFIKAKVGKSSPRSPNFFPKHARPELDAKTKLRRSFSKHPAKSDTSIPVLATFKHTPDHSIESSLFKQSKLYFDQDDENETAIIDDDLDDTYNFDALIESKERKLSAFSEDLDHDLNLLNSSYMTLPVYQDTGSNFFLSNTSSSSFDSLLTTDIYSKPTNLIDTAILDTNLYDASTLNEFTSNIFDT